MSSEDSIGRRTSLKRPHLIPTSPKARRKSRPSCLGRWLIYAFGQTLSATFSRRLAGQASCSTISDARTLQLFARLTLRFAAFL